MKAVRSLTPADVVRINRADWDRMKVRDMHVDTNLIRCQMRLFPRGTGRRLLYIGFGEGQNLLHLLSRGFRCAGTEIAQSRVRLVQAKLRKIGRTADLRLVTSGRLPFDDGSFDVVAAWETLCYNTPETLREALREIRRVLKPGGRFLCSMISSRQKLLCHREVAPCLYRPAPRSGQAHCLVYAIKNRRQIRRLFNGFAGLRIGHYSSDLFGSPSFLYVIYGERPSSTRATVRSARRAGSKRRPPSSRTTSGTT